MKLQHIVYTSIIALAATGAMAQETSTAALQASTTRAQIKSDVVKARQAHELRPAGEGGEYQGPPSHTSTVNRADVKDEVVAARVAGELIPAGEGVTGDAAIDSGPSLLSRAEVKAQVIAARKAGELVPAGEAVDDAVLAHHHPASTTTVRQALAKAWGRTGDTTSR